MFSETKEEATSQKLVKTCLKCAQTPTRSRENRQFLFELRISEYNGGNHPYQNRLICDAFALLCSLRPIVGAIDKIKARNETRPVEVCLHSNLIWLNSV